MVHVLSQNGNVEYYKNVYTGSGRGRRGGGGVYDPTFPLFSLQESHIDTLVSFHKCMSLGTQSLVPNFVKSHFPGAVKFQIPQCFLVKSKILGTLYPSRSRLHANLPKLTCFFQKQKNIFIVFRVLSKVLQHSAAPPLF